MNMQEDLCSPAGTNVPDNKPLSDQDESRLLAAVRDYQAALESGRRPNRRQFLAQHPDIAAHLAECLDGLELVHGAAPRLHDSAPAADLGAVPSLPLGDFRIVREIGRGGMGVVYEAVQLSLGRRVALKVLPLAAALDERRLQRFKHEAQAAAQLHHSNIVPVHAVGCDRGVHFYAMQMIDGQPLTALVKEMRQMASLGSGEEAEEAAVPSAARELATGLMSGRFAAKGPAAETAVQSPVCDDLAGAVTQPARPGDPRRALGSGPHTLKGRGASYYRTVARLGVQAAEGLDHAHQRGVVHRDIKPANLLLDGRGNLWITDFGLAMFHDSGLTGTGDLIGTLRYMSPEQVAGDRVLLDHRTDVYSLGVTLYELLTLRPAFGGDDPGRVVERIRLDDPPLPRSFDKSIPAELETIILKAIAKSPSDRYATAQALAEDLARFLKDRPILARRPSWPERLRKWSRRHPSVVWAGAVVLVLAIAGLLANNWLVSEERRKAVERAEVAERRFHQALDAVDLLIRVTEDELADEPPFHALHRRILEGALTYYQKLIDERGDDAKAQAELSRERERVQRLVADLTALQGMPLLWLTNDASVQKELGLTETQRAALAAQLQRRHEQREAVAQELRGLSSEQRRRKFAERAREDEKSFSTLLSTAQRERLRQIAVQVRGLFAFHDQDIIEALQLTAEQRAQIRDIEESLFMPRPGSVPGQPDEARGKAQDKVKQGIERVEKLLTAEQRRRWQALTGTPVEAAIGAPFRLVPRRP